MTNNPYASETDDPKLYKLLRELPNRNRMRIIRGDGSYSSLSYDDLQSLEGSGDGRVLSLIIRGGLVIHLQGERLMRVADYLEGERGIELIAYDPKRHTHKADDTPIIHSIVETVMKPEE
jgi:hypothetical protein